MDDEKQRTDAPSEKNGQAAKAEDPQIPVDFTTFILSLSTSAMYHLGLAPHPESSCLCENLPMARQTIDILGILQEKTKGNLTGVEERLLAEILYNLRMSFIECTQKCSSRPQAG